MSLRHPYGHLTLHKVFSPMARLGFGVWGTLGSAGQVGGFMQLVTFIYINWDDIKIRNIPNSKSSFA